VIDPSDSNTRYNQKFKG
nr:anti-bacterial ssDNA antibody heavy chain CDR2 region [mice, BALB/c, hybridoma SECF2/3, Peptide Partial, 17 aa] [Mus sp.]